MIISPEQKAIDSVDNMLQRRLWTLERERERVEAEISILHGIIRKTFKAGADYRMVLIEG